MAFSEDVSIALVAKIAAGVAWVPDDVGDLQTPEVEHRSEVNADDNCDDMQPLRVFGSDGTGQCPQDARCHSMGRRELPGRSNSISGSYFWKSTKEVYFNKNSSLCVGVYALPCTVEWGRRGVAQPSRSKYISGSNFWKAAKEVY